MYKHNWGQGPFGPGWFIRIPGILKVTGGTGGSGLPPVMGHDFGPPKLPPIIIDHFELFDENKRKDIIAALFLILQDNSD